MLPFCMRMDSVDVVARWALKFASSSSSRMARSPVNGVTCSHSGVATVTDVTDAAHVLAVSTDVPFQLDGPKS